LQNLSQYISNSSSLIKWFVHYSWWDDFVHYSWWDGLFTILDETVFWLYNHCRLVFSISWSFSFRAFRVVVHTVSWWSSNWVHQNKGLPFVPFHKSGCAGRRKSPRHTWSYTGRCGRSRQWRPEGCRHGRLGRSYQHQHNSHKDDPRSWRMNW